MPYGADLRLLLFNSWQLCVIKFQYDFVVVGAHFTWLRRWVTLLILFPGLSLSICDLVGCDMDAESRPPPLLLHFRRIWQAGAVW
jgi:hypothetical protein